MTFDRANIERLIHRVDSGLQYDELAPYAQALRNCLTELDALRKLAFDIERQRHETAMREIALLTVVESAESWRDAATDDEDGLLMSALMCAIDAYRAARDRP